MMQTQWPTQVWNEGETTVRQWLAQARLEGREDAYAGKRRYPRVSWHMPVTVEILDGPQTGDCEFATSKDISQGGLGLRCRRPLPVRTSVRVMTDEGGAAVHGRVMHCTETVGGYIIGLEFQMHVQVQTMRKSA